MSEALFYNARLLRYYIFFFTVSTLNIQWAPKCINKRIQKKNLKKYLKFTKSQIHPDVICDSFFFLIT